MLQEPITILTEPRVTLLSRPEFIYPEHIPWRSDSENPADVLPEFAGRLCYLSFGKGELDGHRTIGGRPRNADYLQNILDVRHGSVLEHVNFSLLLEGVSRSCSHEIVRHRHHSPSQLSQRYVDESDVAFVLPPEIREETAAYRIFELSCRMALANYRDLLDTLELDLEGEPGSATEKRKRARQAARAVLPNAAETKLVLTGNVRAWRHFLHLRAAPAADMEIRRLAIEVLRVLRDESDTLFGDFTVSAHTDGTQVAVSSYTE